MSLNKFYITGHTKVKIRSMLAGILVFITCTAHTNDSLDVYRQFVKYCNGYQSIPLHVKVDLLNATDVLPTQQDTASSHIEFYLQKEGSYIRMDDIEQLVNDSLMLFISYADKHMTLYKNRNSVKDQLARISGSYLLDSSLGKIAKKFFATTSVSDADGIVSIELKSRENIPSSELPTNQLILKYDTKKELPVEVIQMKRKMTILSEAQYKNLQLQQELKDNLFVTKDQKYFFLVKLHTTTYKYLKIETDNAIKLPQQVSECISKNSAGGYEASSVYGGYTLTELLR